MSIPLFQKFAGLSEQFPYMALCKLPTPVQQLADYDGRLWVKRDDMSATPFGGNKLRKLEFVAPKILASGARKVVTIGATGTSHGVATAVVCKQIGLQCEVITFPQPTSPSVQSAQQWLQAFDAQQTRCNSLAAAAARFYANPARLGKSHFFLPGGGSIAEATLGYVNAALELAEQIAAGQLPQPDVLVLPCGSTGTIAGLTLGCALAGLTTQVLGVPVMRPRLGPVDICTEAAADKLAAKTLADIKRVQPQLTVKVPPVVFDWRWYAPGYGAPRPEVSAAIVAAEREGLGLEQTYSGRAFAAALQLLAETDKTVLYWATYNAHPLPATTTA